MNTKNLSITILTSIIPFLKRFLNKSQFYLLSVITLTFTIFLLLSITRSEIVSASTRSKTDTKIDWSSLVISKNGNVLAALGNSEPYMSVDRGKSWKNIFKDAQELFLSIKISSDGNTIILLGYSSIYISEDRGRNWIEHKFETDIGNFVSISDDSKYIIIGGSNSVIEGVDTVIYMSNDGGVTWEEKIIAPGFHLYNDATISSTGNLIAVLDNSIPGSLYISRNRGTSWENKILNSQYNPLKIASSDDGANIGVILGGSIFISRDSGMTWLQQPISKANLIHVAGSSDGAKLVAMEFGNTYYLSTNYGTTWVERSMPPSEYFHEISISGDGTTLAIAGDDIYTSVDNGMNWVKYTRNFNNNNIGKQTNDKESTPNNYFLALVTGTILILMGVIGTLFFVIRKKVKTN